MAGGVLAVLLSLEAEPDFDRSLVRFQVSALQQPALLLLFGLAVVGVTVGGVYAVTRLSWGSGAVASRRVGWLIAASFVIFGSTTVAAGWLQAHYALKSFRAVRVDQQIAVAKLKATQIDEWTAERLFDLRFLGNSLRALSLADLSSRAELRSFAEVVFAQFLSGNPERLAAGLFTGDGQPVVMQGTLPSEISSSLADDIREAAARNTPYIGLIHAGGARSGGLSVAFLSPVSSQGLAPGIGPMVVVSIVDPTAALLKKFAVWPLGSHSSELELLFRQGNDWIHIVDAGRLASDGPLSLRTPVPLEGLPESLDGARGAATWAGISRGGGIALTASYTVQSFPWLVVARTDFAEAMEPMTREVRLIWTMTIVVLVFGGLLMIAVSTQLRLIGMLGRV